MKKIANILFIALTVTAVSCDRDDNHILDKDKYVYDIPETHIDDAVVGAYYTNITSASSMWTKVHDGTSPMGEYLSTNMEALKQQLQWCDEAGVDFLVFTADEFTKNTPVFVTNFKTARNETGSKVRFIINYNIKHLSISATAAITSEAKLNTFKNDFVNYIAAYMADESYYKLSDGRPVVMVSNLNQKEELWPVYKFDEALDAVRETMADAGESNIYFIGEMTTGWIVPTNYDDYIWEGFDGLTANNWSTNMYDRYVYFHSWMDVNWQRWNEVCSSKGVDFVPCIHPAYNDQVTTGSSALKYPMGQDGNTGFFINNCNVAKRNVGSQKIILVNSWNDFTKGWAMEPTIENEGKYVEICHEQFREI